MAGQETAGVGYGDEAEHREEIHRVLELGWLEAYVNGRVAGFWSDAVG